MSITELNQAALAATKSMPWLTGISSKEEYERLLNVMGELVLDYDSNQLLIDLLFPVIEEYENSAPELMEFNDRISSLDSGVAVLRVLIDQYGLTLSDFKNEIGNKSNVSMILSGQRKLTIRHVKSLSDRFNIPTSLFV